MKFYGKIGYAIPHTDDYGVTTDTIVERQHYGDIDKVSNSIVGAQQVEDNIRLNNVFKIVLDAFITENFQFIKYVEWNGAMWKASSAVVDPDRPRIIIHAGDVYNGPRGDGSYGPQKAVTP